MKRRKEIWKKIRNSLYEASSLGRVRRACPGSATYVGRILNLSTGKDGYMYAQFSDGEGRSIYKVHSLIAEAFLGLRSKGMEVNHIDGNKQNNRWDNLEYLSSVQNHQHAIKLGLWLPNYGSKNGMSKFTEGQVKEIRRLYATGNYSQRSLARMFGVRDVCAIVNRKIWRHI